MLYRLLLVTFSPDIPDEKIEALFNGNKKKSHKKKYTFLTENTDSKIHLMLLLGNKDNTCITHIVCLL